MGARVFLAATLSIAAIPAHAQRREGRRETSVLQVRLPVPVEFGELTFPARTYRVTLGPEGFALADPTTMIMIATVPVTETKTAEAVARPRIDVERKKDKVELVMRAGDRIYRAVGTAGDAPTRRSGSRVVLAGKHERVVEGGGPEKRTASELVARATKRYFSGVKHCADKAHRSRWRTNDHRFIQCVCPIVMRWKMPALDAPLLMHWPLAKGRHGFSFLVSKSGKITECRVWAGAKPPEPKQPSEAETEAAPEAPEAEPAPASEAPAP